MADTSIQSETRPEAEASVPRTKRFTRDVILNLDQADMLRQARERTPYNQVEAAALVGVSQTTYSFWETGESRPSFKNCIALAKVLRIDPNGLLKITHPELADKVIVKK